MSLKKVGKERPFLVIFLRWFFYWNNQLCLCGDWALQLSENKELKGFSRVHLGHLFALFWRTYLKFSGKTVTCSFISLVSFKKFLLFVKSQRLNFIWKYYNVGMRTWMEGYNLLDMCSEEVIFPGNCISACPWGENWSLQNPFVLLLSALNSCSKHDSETQRSGERIQWDSMSSLKNSPQLLLLLLLLLSSVSQYIVHHQVLM